MKLNSDDQTLAESKILLLYILSKVKKSISHNDLLDLVTSIVDMNYFYFQQFLLDLIEDEYVEKTTQDDRDFYKITKKGSDAVDITIDIVPGILKLDVDSKFKENLDSIKDKNSIVAEYNPINDKEYMVRCKIVENDDTLFDLQLHVGSVEQAKVIVENWKSKAIKLYPACLNLLIDEENNDNKKH